MKRFFAVMLVSLCAFIITPNHTNYAQENNLMTRWGETVTPDNVHPEYPRPQLVRENWLNLNGLWDYAVTPLRAEKPETFDGEILVPFPIESALSGVQKRLSFGSRLWYRRTFTVPSDWSRERILLHFGAVDWETKVWVNGLELGTHRGGYDAFSFDITDALNDSGEQELILSVFDPLDKAYQPRGKQVDWPEGIWYTPSTGIWQTVWLEPVPNIHIGGLRMTTDIDAGVLHLETNVTGAAEGYTIQAEVLDGGNVSAEASGNADEALEILIQDVKIWSPDSPHLYDLRVTLLDGDTALDTVTSYFGMRKISLEADADGVMRLSLNNAPIFNFGLLDQGFWPDGLYTAPTDEALRYDIEVTKQLGFNTIRKHVKVESARWYYWADKLGVLVWQDMPNGDALVGWGEGELQREAASAAQFELELQRLIDSHVNHPSIIMWVIFNEGWGQYDTVRLTEWLKAYDPTRLVNSASGWNDMQVGDVYDIHSYPGPDAPEQSANRASVLGEFGGLGLPIEGHLWDTESWGYRAYDDTDALLSAYSALIEQLATLVKTRGLAAAIYTQTTDVETEVNGMMTYDREVIKLDVEQVRAINATVYDAAP